MPVAGIGGQGTTGAANAATAAAAAASSAAAAGAAPDAGPTSVADAVSQMGEASAAAASGDTGVAAPGPAGGGQANPIAAAMMNAELGKGITETGNPNSPHGEISPQQAGQIAQLAQISQDNAVSKGFMTSMPVIGQVLSLLDNTGLVSMTPDTPGIESSIADTIADTYGGGAGMEGIANQFGGFSTVDPGVQAAMDAIAAGRQAQTEGLIAGATPAPDARRWYEEDEAAAAPGNGNGLAPGTTGDPPPQLSAYHKWLGMPAPSAA